MSVSKPLAKEEVAKYFSSLASTYNKNNYVLAGKRGKYPDIFRRHGYILEMMKGLQGRALEIGCGSGELLCSLLKRNFEVVGIDLAQSMIEASRDLVVQRCEGKRVDAAVADIENLPFRAESFDLVIAAGVIEYLASDEKALRGLYRILRPGGVVILSVRNKVNLSRLLVTARDLLISLLLLGSLISSISGLARRLFSLAPNAGIPARRHIPWQFRRCMRELGFEPKDEVFYHFTVLPRFLERRFPEFCFRWEEKLEALSRSRLGYFANQYVLKAEKALDGDYRT
jgi:ubiquinone/menaquinone biosynthesis C-methylase UbiE